MSYITELPSVRSHHGFPHTRLRAYQRTLAFHRFVVGLKMKLPGGMATLYDQLKRASISNCLNLAEGVSLPTPAHFIALAHELGPDLDLPLVPQSEPSGGYSWPIVPRSFLNGVGEPGVVVSMISMGCPLGI